MSFAPFKVINSNEYDETTDVSEKYLIRPFMDCINDPNFFKSTKTMKILSAPTGFGKTYSMTKKGGWIDTVFKHGVKVVLVSMPDTGIMTEEDRKICAFNCNAYLANNMEEVEKLAKDKKVDRILMIRHASMFTPAKLPNLLRVTSDISLFADEVHWGTCSDIENYREVHGNTTTDYQAVLYKFAERLAQYTPYTFGLTATPTTEQDDGYEGGLTTVKGKMDYKIINPWPTADDILGRVAYIDSPRTFNIHDEDSATDALRSHVARVTYHNNTYPTKIAGAMWIGSDNASTGYNFSWALRSIYDLLIDMGNFDENGENRDFTILSSEMKGDLIFYKEPRASRPLTKRSKKRLPAKFWHFVRKNESEVLDSLRSHNTTQKHLILKEKGKMGIDVPTIKSVLVLKATDKTRPEDRGGSGITESIIQRFGRAFRLNASGELADAIRDNNYSLYGVVESLDDHEFEEFIESNTIKVVVPSDNTMVVDGLRRIMDKPYCIGYAAAKSKWTSKRNLLTN